jgi:hypothetical protein
MHIPPLLDEDLVAQKLRALRKDMSILRMERESGVSRQVLYRIMGGTSINRSPYEIVVRILHLLAEHYPREILYRTEIPTAVLHTPGVPAYRESSEETPVSV